MQALLKSKTAWVGVGMVVAALGGYFTGELDVMEAIKGALTGLGMIAARHAFAKGR